MTYLTLRAISLKTPDLGRTLVDDLTLSFGRERTGLVGRNGCGKSSLLAVMAGRAQPAAGSVTPHGRIGFFRQTHDDLSLPVLAALGIEDAFAALERVVSGRGSDVDLAAADWTLQARLEVALTQSGLIGLDPATPLSQLSGGQRMRVSVARSLLEAADLLLLDEPTNNLDAAGQQMITELVAGWPGGVVVAGHDRALLEHMDRTLELSQTGARLYTGGWSAYNDEKALEVTRAQAALVRAARGVKSTNAAIQRQHDRKARRDKTGRAKRAKQSEPRVSLDRQKGRAEKTLGRDTRQADTLKAKAASAHAAASEQVEVLTPIHIDLPAGSVPENRVLLRMQAAEIRHATGKTLGPWSLEIRGPERVRLTGPNGAGKSTLMKLAAGLLTASNGRVERIAHTAYLDQDLTLPLPEGSLVGNMRQAGPDMNDHAARAALARFGFRNTAADRAVSGLSGGERLRLALCMTAAGAVTPELLVLDEPTNHLDTAAVALLETTLQAYQGAILFVTHDERFSEALRPARSIAVT